MDTILALKDVNVLIRNGSHKSDSSSEMKISKRFISNLTNLTLISSHASKKLLDDEGNDDFNNIINLKGLEKELKKFFMKKMLQK